MANLPHPRAKAHSERLSLTAANFQYLSASKLETITFSSTLE